MRPNTVLLITALIVAAPIAGAALTTNAAPADRSPPAVDAGDGALVALEAPGSNAAWAREIVRELPRATAVNDGDGDKLFDTLEDRYALVGGAELPVVVTFRHDVSADEGLAQLERVAGPLDVTRSFTLIPALAARMDLAQALRVASVDEVRQLEWDRPGTLELDTATRFMGADHVVDVLGFTGDRDGDETTYTPDDVVVAILDTGFHGEHMDLDDGKIIQFVDLGDGREQAWDAGSHGTHVASIAVGTGDADPDFRGVAPGAGMVGLKIVQTDCGAGDPITGATDCESSLSLAIAGYEYIVEHRDHYGIDVSTISFGFGIATDGTTALELAVDATWDAGVVNFKSTGNSGPERRTITVPAAARGILATGAMLDPGGAGGAMVDTPVGVSTAAAEGFQLATFSSRGPTTDGRVKPDIAAPGVSVNAAEAGTKDGYVAFSGTSMASPFAAGTAALVLDANPALTPDDVRDVLTSTTEDWGLEGDDVDYGWGRLQVAAAVEEALARAGQPAPTPVDDDGEPITLPVPFHEARAGTLDPTIAPPARLAGARLGAGQAVASTTIDVEDTTHAFAATAIVEGLLFEIIVEGPDGELVASFSPLSPVGRQHVVGFEATQPGTYTVHLVGEPMAAWVLDVSHGTANGLAVELPAGPVGQEGLEQASTDEPAEAIPVPTAGWIVGALALAAVVSTARRRQD